MPADGGIAGVGAGEAGRRSRMSGRATEKRGSKEEGHGHGMSRNRAPRGASLPHDGSREDKQPYAREVEDYSGAGVTNPPREKTRNR
jgi:hypothetical protein